MCRGIHCFICGEEGHRVLDAVIGPNVKEGLTKLIERGQLTLMKQGQCIVMPTAQDVSVNGAACLHTLRDANSGQNKVVELVGSNLTWVLKSVFSTTVGRKHT